jgi:CRISPR-associated endoribonuclease Cas6
MERTCFTDSVDIMMMTPLCVYTTHSNGNRRFYSPENEEFCQSVEKNLISKYEAFYGYKPCGAVSLEPVAVVPEDKCVTKYKGWYITGYRGQYRLSAPPDVIDFAYHTGLGVKNSAGFGLFQY